VHDAAAVLGTQVAETILASGLRRSHQTGRTYGRKRAIKIPKNSLRVGGRPHTDPVRRQIFRLIVALWNAGTALIDAVPTHLKAS